MTQKRVSLVGVFVLLLCSSCQSVLFYTFPGYSELSSARVELPAKFSCGAILVKTGINGGEPRWFLLDTGADVLVLNERHYPSSQFPKLVYTATATGMLDESAPMPLVQVDRVDIGDAKFWRLSAIVFTEVLFSRLGDALGEDVAGIIGANVFGDVTLSLDYIKRSVTVSKVPVPQPDGRTILALSPAGPTPHIDSTVGDQAFSVLLDTGVSGRPFIDSGEIRKRLSSVVPADMMITANARRRSARGRLNADIRFGEFVLTQPIVSTNLEPQDDGAGTEPVIYGRSVLERFVTHLDFPNRRVRFDLQSPDSVLPDTLWRTDGLGVGIQDGDWRVIDLIPGTPAVESGISLGDQVTQVNGESASSETLCRANDGRSHNSYRLIRDGEPFDARLPLIQPIP